jgi:hypothetical protein
MPTQFNRAYVMQNKNIKQIRNLHNFQGGFAQVFVQIIVANWNRRGPINEN